MIKRLFVNNYQHCIAIIIFALVAIVYCHPTLDGKVLQQTDVIQWRGMAQDALIYKEKNGTTPLWTNSMFCGMPTYQITGIPASKLSLGALDGLMTLKLPEPISLFFLAALSFYFLAQILGFNSVISIICSLCYSYATYNPIIVSVGHMTKMHAIGYLPFLIGSVLLLFKRNYIFGGILLAISTSLFVQANHLQITYYGVIIVILISFFYAIKWLKKKEYKNLLLTFTIALFAAGLGVGVNAPMLVSTYEYGKESIRGGSALQDKKSDISETGLSKDYALSYSIFKSEIPVLMFAHLYGGSSDPSTIDFEKTKSMAVLQNMPPGLAQQFQSFVQFYWGGIGVTSGPPYIGFIICFFAIIGFSAKNNEHRYWIGVGIALSFILATGIYFESINVWILKYLPFYNKFRAPSMILVIPTLLLGIMSMYGLNAITKEQSIISFYRNYKFSIFFIGCIFCSIILFYLFADFKSSNDILLLGKISSISNPEQKAVFEKPAIDLINAMIYDRKELIRSDLIKSFIFCVLIIVFSLIYFKNWINQKVLLLGLGTMCLLDIFLLDLHYLNSEHYQEKTENENIFTLTPIDILLKKDTTNYRLFDLRNGIQSAFNSGALIAFHHNTIGGYNPAKLSIYQDLIENQLLNYPNCDPVLNMLNTKYTLTGDLIKDTVQNPNALGNAWFVKEIHFEKKPSNVMKQLSSFNPKSTAIVEEKDKIAQLNEIQFDSTSTISQIYNHNDEIEYHSTSKKTQFAVFSEIYYNKGWKAFVDNVETPIVKTNYVLRGIVIKEGSHNIKYVFNPDSVYLAKIISDVSSLILWSLLIILSTYAIMKRKFITIN
jgi:hypothetical protein